MYALYIVVKYLDSKKKKKTLSYVTVMIISDLSTAFYSFLHNIDSTQERNEVDKRFSEFLGGKRKRFSEFLGGKKRFSEFLGGKRKRFSEFLGGKKKRFSEFLGGKKKRFSEFLGGKRSATTQEILSDDIRKRFSEFLGGKRSADNSYNEKRFSEFLGGKRKRSTRLSPPNDILSDQIGNSDEI